MKTQSLKSSLFVIVLLVAGIFLGIAEAKAAPGDIRVTVTRQGDDAALEGVLVEIKCSGGDYTAFDGSPLTDASGQVMGAPPAGANCDFDEETINARATLQNYVTKNNESGPLQGWFMAADPNDINLSGVEFGFSVYVADQFGTAIDTVDSIQFNGNAPTLQDPVETNRFYWEDTGTSNRELVIEKDGFVNFSTTNTGGTDISTTQTEQVLITLGNNSVCSNPIVGPDNCKGLEYGYVYSGIRDELGVDLSTVTLTAGQANVSCIEAAGAWYCPVTIADSAYDRYVALKDGYVERTNPGGLAGGSRSVNADPQLDLGIINNIQFSHKFITKDELGNNLTLTSATAGASNVACTISSNNVYCPITLGDDNTLSNGLVGVKDGYVTTTAADVPLGSNRALHSAAQALTTMTTVNGLDFAHKVIVKDELNNALTPTSVAAGEGLTDCIVVGNSAYCPIPLGNDDTAGYGFYITKDGYRTAMSDEVELAGNRTLGTDSQFVTTMTGSNGLDFAHKVVIVDELGTALTPTSATAGSAGVSCTISGNSAYCPVLLAQDNTAANGFVIVKDGYVTTSAAAVPLAGNRTSDEDNQQVTTMTTTNGLDFALKVTVTKQSDAAALNVATVTAGNAYGTTCSENGVSGIYYCAIPVNDTATTVSATKTGYTNSTGVFIDRSLATDPQRSIGISMAAVVISSGGGSAPITGGASGFATTPPPTTNPTTPTSPITSEPIKTDIVSRIKTEAELIFSQPDPLFFYINTGTPSTYRLGIGERRASVNSFREVFTREAASLSDWEDILNIANGRWPFGIVKTVEARAYTNFKLVYGRNASMTNSTDVNALKMMGYGVMHKGPRNLNIERQAIGRFIRIFGFAPSLARHWNIIRAISYSGVLR